jgi:hypothetical protein
MFNWLKTLIRNAMTRQQERKQLEGAFDTAAADSKNALPLDPENDPWRK